METKIINMQYMPVSIKKKLHQSPKFSKHEAHLLARIAG